MRLESHVNCRRHSQGPCDKPDRNAAITYLRGVISAMEEAASARAFARAELMQGSAATAALHHLNGRRRRI